MNRRSFLVTAAAAQRVLGANDKVRIGLIGCGGRGRYVARLMREAPGCEFVAAADVYRTNAEAARQWAGPQAASYEDFRRVLERPDVDAVLVATPDHWHAAIAVLACQAGKDVYVEKPLAHNVREGRAIVNAARQYRRLVQTGTQHRSAPHFAEVEEIVRSGALGEVRYVRVWNYLNRTPKGLEIVPDSAPPEGLNWDFWLGPAPKVPFNQARFLATYRWFWDYSGGFVTDFGTHRFDTVHQVMGVDAPRTVSAAGLKFLKEAGEIPDMVQVTWEYEKFILTYEGCLFNGHGIGGRTPGMRYYNALGEQDRPNGIAFYGTNGAIFADRVGYELYPEPESRSSAKPRVEARRTNTTDATGLHARAFVECVRGRKTPPGEAEIGHRATTVAHLGNIAFKTGRKLTWDRDREDFEGAPEASRLLARPARAPWNLIQV